ncbi:alpha/beta hydrolase family protein [Pseudomonas rubra]|uniref:Alpha/beta hydrolase family protein n=1 Tax=Pseudomonas rubra TaxID=2942627 RepID=A0ABT5PFZ4_9PSED|nr:alpha/beta hydrolase family protein [Pseudomonas rubra]MDD1016923.1 alpha/beta hydrolase family protein [Pseudomonas rubra]MDD1041080.1 alpha/beta hydrolase family protein [Pseudomonas rubra]MDD1157507.1 alpha/beta hydrolase family protein [Pseudomonas rubra]
MFALYRTTLPALCLSLILPCTVQAAAGETPEPAADIKPAAVERQPLAERSQEDALALERQVPQAEQQTLQAGSDSFLALWKPANTPDPEGALIILAGAGETADWPKTVGPLRHKFPDAGWHSLSLAQPDLLGDSPQARVEAAPAPAKKAEQGESAPVKDTPANANASIEQATTAENETSESTEQAKAPVEDDKADAERIFARLDTAVAYAQQHNARSIVLLGNGTGAYWAARYLNERQPAQVQKLVMVAAQTPARAEQGLDSLAPSLKVPTADFFYAALPPAKRAAEQRLQASKRLKDANYRQISLTAMPGNSAAEQEQLFRRIRGWLSPQQLD